MAAAVEYSIYESQDSELDITTLFGINEFSGEIFLRQTALKFGKLNYRCNMANIKFRKSLMNEFVVDTFWQKIKYFSFLSVLRTRVCRRYTVMFL